MSKKIFFIAAVVSLLVPAVLRAQVIGVSVPKIEISVGGGIGYGGYATSMPANPWMTHVATATDGGMDFFAPKAHMTLAGHGGVYMDYHFNDHWGIITGAEFGVYYTNIDSKNLLNVQTYDPRDLRPINSPARPITRASSELSEEWIASDLLNYEENHRMYALQIPIMAKYMVPISPAGGHQYYVAAGAKIGIHVLKELHQEFDYDKFVSFAYRRDPNDPSAYTHITTTTNTNRPLTLINPSSKFTDPSEANYWYTGKIKGSPIDVMASFDTGFRWNLGSGFGIYTGLYCDFGLIRAVARQRGSKVLNFDESNVSMQGELGNNHIVVNNVNCNIISVLAADAPDYCYVKETIVNADQAYENVFVKNTSPMSKIANAMQAGLKLRFSFGKAEKKPKVVRPPKEPKPKKVPNEIKQTMIELSDALFAFDKFDLNENSRALLDKVTDWLKDNPDLNVEIAGHTDDRGSDAYNQKLSENRAKAVYDYITSHGVDKSRLSYKGYGESQPIATNETDEGRQKNRRVELHIK